jgi:hypothetical protein
VGAGGEGRCSAEPQHQGTDAAPADLGNATDVPAHPRRGQHAQHEEGERHTEDDVRRVHALHVHAPPPALRAPRALRAPSVAAPKAALLPSRHRTPSVAAAAGYALSASSHITRRKGRCRGGEGRTLVTVLAPGTRGGSDPVRAVCLPAQIGASVRARDSATGHVHRRRCRSVPAPRHWSSNRSVTERFWAALIPPSTPDLRPV